MLHSWFDICSFHFYWTQADNLIPAFYCRMSAFLLVFHHGKEKMETEKKAQLWHIHSSYAVYSGAATLEITHQGEPRRAMEHLSFQGSAPEMKFKVSFPVFNIEKLLINSSEGQIT